MHIWYIYIIFTHIYQQKSTKCRYMNIPNVDGMGYSQHLSFLEVQALMLSINDLGIGIKRWMDT